MPPDQRLPLSEGSISFASAHCNSKSGREDLVRAMMKDVPVVVVGSTCLRNAPDSLLRLERDVSVAGAGVAVAGVCARGADAETRAPAP